MNKQYHEFYDQLAYTPEQKHHLARLAAEEALRGPKRRKNGFLHMGRLAAAAACLAAVLTVSAEASGIPTPLSEVIGPLFGGSIAQCRVIDSIGYPVEAGDTDNGVAVRAEAILGDAYNAAFVFSFSREDGEPILPEGVEVSMLNLGGFGDVELQRMGGSHGFARFLDLVPGDHEIHYLYCVSSDAPLNKGTVKVAFHNLYANQETKESREPILEGSWKFRFQVDYADSSMILGNGETFQQGGMTFTIREIRLSPIAVQVTYEVDSAAEWSDAPSGRMPEEDRRQVERYLETVQLLLHKKDGKVIDLTYYAGGSIQPENGRSYCTKGTVLEEILPLDSLESITVGGVTYPIS